MPAGQLTLMFFPLESDTVVALTRCCPATGLTQTANAFAPQAAPAGAVSSATTSTYTLLRSAAGWMVSSRNGEPPVAAAPAPMTFLPAGHVAVADVSVEPEAAAVVALTSCQPDTPLPQIAHVRSVQLAA